MWILVSTPGSEALLTSLLRHQFSFASGTQVPAASPFPSHSGLLSSTRSLSKHPCPSRRLRCLASPPHRGQASALLSDQLVNALL